MSRDMTGAARLAKASAAVAAMWLTTAAGAPPREYDVKWNVASPPRGQATLQAAMLSGHNGARYAVGVPPLRWNARLAADAAAYAATLAASGQFEHSPQPHGSPAQGESLWMGTRGAYDYDDMVGYWLREKRYYRDRPTPDFSSTGDWSDVAHYTQVVWSGTREVGCAMASDADDDYLVCRYLPAGNVIGETAYRRPRAAGTVQMAAADRREERLRR